jgi:hypothetical protein
MLPVIVLLDLLDFCAEAPVLLGSHAGCRSTWPFPGCWQFLAKETVIGRLLPYLTHVRVINRGEEEVEVI